MAARRSAAGAGPRAQPGDAAGTARVGGVPITGFYAQKAAGHSPVLGIEGGVLLSEVKEKRLALGVKGWVYGASTIQASASGGLDLTAGSAFAALHVENGSLLGKTLSFDARYEHTLEGKDAIKATLGVSF